MSVLRWIANALVPVLAVTALLGQLVGWSALALWVYLTITNRLPYLHGGSLLAAVLLLTHGTAVSVWLLTRGGRLGDLDRLREIAAMQAAGRQAAQPGGGGQRPARFH